MFFVLVFRVKATCCMICKSKYLKPLFRAGGAIIHLNCFDYFSFFNRACRSFTAETRFRSSHHASQKRTLYKYLVKMVCKLVFQYPHYIFKHYYSVNLFCNHDALRYMGVRLSYTLVSRSIHCWLESSYRLADGMRCGFLNTFLVWFFCNRNLSACDITTSLFVWLFDSNLIACIPSPPLYPSLSHLFPPPLCVHVCICVNRSLKTRHGAFYMARWNLYFFLFELSFYFFLHLLTQRQEWKIFHLCSSTTVNTWIVVLL